MMIKLDAAGKVEWGMVSDKPRPLAQILVKRAVQQRNNRSTCWMVSLEGLQLSCEKMSHGVGSVEKQLFDCSEKMTEIGHKKESVNVDGW